MDLRPDSQHISIHDVLDVAIAAAVGVLAIGVLFPIYLISSAIKYPFKRLEIWPGSPSQSAAVDRNGAPVLARGFAESARPMRNR
ncbi:MAG TPA: hypothetical protein VG675_11895 [Bryobacteraceae bacterium]|nr:hypothetical protein [Bryobacteraceae bacterium]